MVTGQQLEKLEKQVGIKADATSSTEDRLYGVCQALAGHVDALYNRVEDLEDSSSEEDEDEQEAADDDEEEIPL